MESLMEMFPSGRTIYFEGDDPEDFARDMRVIFGFDVKSVPGHNIITDEPMAYTWDQQHGWSFHCPAEYLDAVYGSGLWPMGS